MDDAQMLAFLQAEGVGEGIPVCELCEDAVASVIHDQSFLCRSCRDHLLGHAYDSDFDDNGMADDFLQLLPDDSVRLFLSVPPTL